MKIKILIFNHLWNSWASGQLYRGQDNKQQTAGINMEFSFLEFIYWNLNVNNFSYFSPSEIEKLVMK